MKVYTSYFANANRLKAAGIVPVGISLYPPKWFTGTNLSYLAPTKALFKISDAPDEIYVPRFRKEVLEVIKQEMLMRDLESASKFPIMPSDYEITRKSNMCVFIEDTNIAEYYRRLWLHRIQGKSVTFNICVVIDGYLAGFIGLDLRPVIKPYKGDEDFIILSYAVAAPNDRLRNARLMVHIAKSKYILNKIMAGPKGSQFAVYMPLANRLCTVEYSRYAEVKGLRGLMKLENRKKISDKLNALYYYADLTGKNDKDIINDFINAEEQWKKTKK